MGSETITSYFKADHDRLDSLFQQFQKAKDQSIDEAKPFFKEFNNDIRRHIVWEEEILFPLFEDKTGMKGAGPTNVMRLEHRSMKEALDRIHSKLREGRTDTDSDEAAVLFVLREHNEKEETILYPMIDRLTPEGERKDVFLRMEEVPPEKYRVACCGGHPTGT